MSTPKIALSHIREHFHWVAQASDADDYSRRALVEIAVARAAGEVRDAADWKRAEAELAEMSADTRDGDAADDYEGELPW